MQFYSQLFFDKNCMLVNVLSYVYIFACIINYLVCNWSLKDPDAWIDWLCTADLSRSLGRLSGWVGEGSLYSPNPDSLPSLPFTVVSGVLFSYNELSHVHYDVSVCVRRLCGLFVRNDVDTQQIVSQREAMRLFVIEKFLWCSFMILVNFNKTKNLKTYIKSYCSLILR